PRDAIPPAPEVSPVTSSCPDWEDASPLGPRGVSVVAALADDDVLSLSGAFVWHWDGVTHRAAPLVLEGSPGPTPCEPLFWSDLHREGELWWATTHDGEVWHGRLLSTLSRQDLFEGRALAVSGTSPSDVWVAGDGGLAHFDGQTWTTRALDARFTVTDVHAISPDLVWVTATWSETETLAGPSRLYRSVRTDTGLEFEVAHELTGDLRSVWAHGTEAWVVGRSAEGDGRTVFAHFDGQTWSPLTPPPLYELHELTGHYGEAVELWVWGVGTLHHWRDEAWREVLFGDLGTGFGTRSLSSTGPGRAWAENGHNLIHITPQRVGMLRGACCHLFDLEAASPDELWFTGERGLLMHHDGATYTMDESLFESLELVPLPAMFGLWRSPASRDAASGPPTTWLWAVGHDGKTAQVRRREVPLGARPTDLTEPWITVTVPPPARDAKLLDIWGADLEHLWVVGLIGEADHQPAEGVLLEWDGETLRPADLERPTPSTPIGGLRVVTGTAANDVWAVGRGDALHHFDGSRWSTYRLPFPLNLNDATAVAPGLLFATGAPDTFDQGYYFGVAIEVDLARSEPVQLLRFLDDEPLMASWRSRSTLDGVAVDSQGNLWLGDDKTWDRVARWSEFLPPTEGRIVHDGQHLWLLLIDGQALRSPASVVWKP
ncbi:MAG TPA: hypothetical protein PK095_06900, partial [Myxococcota bacterium]|nr:hypothetical protein [Myxococcota bacterium]